MGAVKAPNANMNDTRGDGSSVVVRRGDIGSKTLQMGVIEMDHVTAPVDASIWREIAQKIENRTEVSALPRADVIRAVLTFRRSRPN
jgi:hypothetical protein|tara:strand:- start:13879 stop:14139 length:261 start_codon:yes stop_codon:yes gene_type:complete